MNSFVERHDIASLSVIGSDADMEGFVDRARRGSLISVGLRTCGDDPLSGPIRLIEVATEDLEVAVADIRDMSPGATKILKELFSDASIKKVAYDWIKTGTFLERAGFDLKGPLFDAKIASQLIDAGLKDLEHHLDSLLDDYLYARPLECESDHHLARVFEKDAARTAALLPLREALVDELDRFGLVYVAKIEFECIPAVMQMHIEGIGVDRGRMESFRGKLEEKIKREEKKFFSGLEKEININSSKQVLSALNESERLIAMGIVLKSTKKEEIQQYAEACPEIRTLLEYRRLKTLLDKIKECLNAIHPETGRVHPTYVQMGAVSGRFSCCEPNVQGMPKDKEIRQLFVPEEGNKLIVADFSQVELRVAAAISRDEKMIAAFQRGDDFHSLTASIVTGKPLSAITPSDRKSAKAVNFGVLFGMGAEGLCTYALKNYGKSITLGEARTFIDAFLDAYPELDDWRECQIHSGHFETRTMSGRARFWGNRSAPRGTALINTPIQGTAADIIKLALGELGQALAGMDARIVACVHDEIVVEAGVEDVEKAADALQNAMEEAGRSFLEPVPVVVDMEIADSWAGKR